MKEMRSCVSHQQTSQLLHNKFIVVIGDSIQRSVYKDLVMLLQKESYLSQNQLRSKGERTFEKDCLVEGGTLDRLHNGINYREVRQFQSDHHLVRFYFVTRIYSNYMRSILEDFHLGLKPDLVIVNSCVWDISRYNRGWIKDYRKNLHRFFYELKKILPEETLVIWNLTMPLGERIRGGFLVPEVQHVAPQLRFDVIEANCYSGTLADAYGMDVLDLHFQFRFSLRHRTNDGVHWDAVAHRKITSLLMQHAAQAWGIILTVPLAAVEQTERIQLLARESAPELSDCKPTKNKYDHCREFPMNNRPYSHCNTPAPLRCNYETLYMHRTLLPTPPMRRLPSLHGRFRSDFIHGPSPPSEPYRERCHSGVMRSRHTRHHYTPYSHHRPSHHGWYSYFY